MKPGKLLTGIAAMTLSFAVFAQPAPWYKWKSKLNGKIVCTQTSPGEGWERDSGPYKDARCEQPGTR
jgi:hypothetical protein